MLVILPVISAKSVDPLGHEGNKLLEFPQLADVCLVLLRGHGGLGCRATYTTGGRGGRIEGGRGSRRGYRLKREGEKERERIFIK